MAEESSEILRDLLANAIPVNPTTQGQFVSREEFMATVKTIEQKIENAALKTKAWVLSGCVAILISFGSGYISLNNKLNRLTEALPQITTIQQGRAPWIQRQEQRDAMQDDVLKKLDKNYQPLPYEPAPQ